MFRCMHIPIDIVLRSHPFARIRHVHTPSYWSLFSQICVFCAYFGFFLSNTRQGKMCVCCMTDHIVGLTMVCSKQESSTSRKKKVLDCQIRGRSPQNLYSQERFKPFRKQQFEFSLGIFIKLAIRIFSRRCVYCLIGLTCNFSSRQMLVKQQSDQQLDLYL